MDAEVTQKEKNNLLATLWALIMVVVLQVEAGTGDELGGLTSAFSEWASANTISATQTVDGTKNTFYDMVGSLWVGTMQVWGFVLGVMTIALTIALTLQAGKVGLAIGLIVFVLSMISVVIVYYQVKSGHIVHMILWIVISVTAVWWRQDYWTALIIIFAFIGLVLWVQFLPEGWDLVKIDWGIFGGWKEADLGDWLEGRVT